MSTRAIPDGTLWTPDGWQAGRRVQVDARGRVEAVVAGRDPGRRVVPGIANLHSHAFQRAMAGMAERQTDPADSFWTWRETMYHFASRFSPDTLYAVASQLYAEMLESGYTRVCEFHYLHHTPSGGAYRDPTAMSQALVSAARDTGIRMTLLPVLYMRGGFDGRDLVERQRRFGHDVDDYLALVDRLCEDASDTLHVGCALHSLRAVPPDAMATVLDALPPAMPVHVHIAEQVAEVEECIAVRGARPVAWLLDHADVDARWTLVHATHLDDGEVAGIARSGATVALCPTTEANLGDGLFPLRGYLDAGGSWGIGSDSHISVSPVEELRWLEYGQRLATRRRNIAVDGATPSVGETLFKGVAASASRSSGHAGGCLQAGGCADAVVLDMHAPQLMGATDADVLDRWLFSGNRNLVDEVYVGGRRVVDGGRHHDRDAIAGRYRDALASLMQA